MKESIFSWTASDSIPIHAVEWKPESTVKAVVAYIHGLGDHCSRYRHMAEAYSHEGIAMLAVDLPGHGESGGKRGHASFSGIMEVIDRLLLEAAVRFNGRPIFLAGLSMGGLITLDYLIERKPDIAGAVVMSPALAAKEPVAAWRRFAAVLLAGIWPTLTISNGLPPEGCSDPEVLEDWNKDPLAHDLVSTRLGRDILKAQPRVVAMAGEIRVPLLVEQGGADRIVDPVATERLLNAVKNVTYRRFEDLDHDIPHEPGKEQVFKVATDWIAHNMAR